MTLRFFKYCNPLSNYVTGSEDGVDNIWWKCDKLSDHWIKGCKSPLEANSTLLRLFLRIPKSPLLIATLPCAQFDASSTRNQNGGRETRNILIWHCRWNICELSTDSAYILHQATYWYRTTSRWVTNQRWRPRTRSAYEITCSAAMRDSNKIPMAILMFLRSSNMTALREYCPLSWWVAYQRWQQVTESGYMSPWRGRVFRLVQLWCWTPKSDLH